MRRLMSCGLVLLLAACSQSEPEPVEPPPNFCDLTEDREFGFDEFDWRAENAPGNLRYQIIQNELRGELCPDP